MLLVLVRLDEGVDWHSEVTQSIRIKPFLLCLFELIEIGRKSWVELVVIAWRQKVDSRLLKPTVIKLWIRPLIAHLSHPDAQWLQQFVRFKLLLPLSYPLTVQLWPLLIQLFPELFDLHQLILWYHTSLCVTFILEVDCRRRRHEEATIFKHLLPITEWVVLIVHAARLRE